MKGERSVPAANTLVARRFFRDVLAGRDERAADELIAPHARVSLPTGHVAGPEGVKRASARLGSAFPDLRIEVTALVAEGDRVTAEWTFCGTQQRELLGVPPSGRRECVSAFSLFRIENARIVEHVMTEDAP